MVQSTARVSTGRAGRYLAQLCAHFAYKVEARHEDGRGFADFGWGTCILVATPDALLLHAQSPDPDGLARVEYVVADHAERFGARDGLTVAWERH